MRRKGMTPCGMATAIVFATGMPDARAAAQEAADAFSGDEPVEPPIEFSAAAATSVAGPEFDVGGLGCGGEEGIVALDSGREEGAAQDENKCPEWVALDDFEDVDYGRGIGITMCRLTEEYTIKKGASILGALTAGIKAIFGGEVKGEAKGWRETTRTRCDYYGCGLDISLSEAVWATRN
ncbi:MAG: hypothetical protein F4059_02050 [Gemmatimonadetes bacterium]|nr:hypothetical protein [Gemmatimonadota bacterium]